MSVQMLHGGAHPPVSVVAPPDGVVADRASGATVGLGVVEGVGTGTGALVGAVLALGVGVGVEAGVGDDVAAKGSTAIFTSSADCFEGPSHESTLEDW